MPPRDAEDAEPGASTIPNDRHWLGQEQITVTQELTQKEKAEYAEEYAEVAASIARAFNHMPDDEVAIKDVAAEMADAEIMRQQLCLICPKLPIHIEVAYRMKLEAIAMRTNFQGQLDL